MRVYFLLVLLVFAWSEVAAHGAAADSKGDPANTVLFLGDSLSMGVFGKSFDESLRERSLRVYTHVAGGASPYYWLSKYEPISCNIGYWEKTPTMERRVPFIRKVPKIEALLGKYEPDVVVIQTGVNLYSALRSKQRSRAENAGLVSGLIRELCEVIKTSGARLYWINPPDSHPKRYPEELQDQLAGIIKDVVVQCGGRVFDSAAVTEWVKPYPSESDGIHYGPVEAGDWAGKVTLDFEGFLAGEGAQVQAQAVVASVPDKNVEVKAPLRAVPIRGRGDGPAMQTGREVDVKMVLKAKSSIDHMNEVIYKSAFGLFEYEIEEIYEGVYSPKTIRVAHMIVLNKRETSPNRYTIGKSYSLRLVKLSQYPQLERIQLIDKLPLNLDLPVYVCKF